MTEQDLQIIESYLNGNLTGEEQGEFFRRLKEDQEFKSTVSQMRASIAAIRQAALDERLELIKEEEKKLVDTDYSAFRIAPIYRWVAMAAALILGIFLLKPLLKEDNTIRNQYLAEHFDAYILHDIQKGSSPESEKIKAYTFYSNQDFDRAIPILIKNWDENKDTLSLFYLWVSAKATKNSILEKKYQRNILEISKYNNKYENLVNQLLTQ